MENIKGIYKVELYKKEFRKWVLISSEKRTLGANKKYWWDCHKYDFSSSHKITLRNNIMTYYESISPDKNNKITYTLMEVKEND